MERTSVLRILGLLLCVWGGQGETLFFNIDTSEPILRRSPALLNDTHLDKDDFFGFAIALHQAVEVAPGDEANVAAQKTRLLVGAPTGTFPGGLNIEDRGVPALKNTGLLYSCSLVPGAEPLCDAVLGDEFDDVDNDTLHAAGRLFDHRPNAVIQTQTSYIQAEQKEGQLMGATIQSRGDTVVICAPAWTSTGLYDPDIDSPRLSQNFPFINNAYPRGRCYWTNRELKNVSYLDPCNSPAESPDIRVDKGQAYCTAGTGVTILGPRRFVIGAPGYDRGIGALFYGSDEFELLDRTNNPTIGRGNIGHDQNGTLRQVVESSQGFQVTTGYITIRKGDNTLPNVVASVHRFDNTVYKGRVDVYNVSETGGSIQNLLGVTAEGEQIAEFFGYALATADLNNDGYDELVVGAPMYSQIEPDMLRVETGRVYVFWNTNGALSLNPIRLSGRVQGGRLGMSVVNVGDIDLDGYEDVAVGAPYERNGASTGAVYIYYGNRDSTLFGSQQPGVVTGQSIADKVETVSSLNTFGFSLSSLDVDGNKYNDLAIGAFDSGAVVVLRSRPVANVTVSLTTSKDEVKRSEKTCKVGGTSYACFDVTVDVGFSGAGVITEQVVEVALKENRFNGEQRIFFDQTTKESEISVMVDPSSPRTVRVYLKNGIIDSSSSLELVAEVQQNVPSSSPGNGVPVISDFSPNFIIRQLPSASTMVTLANNCVGECDTDFALSLQSVTYLAPPPDRGVQFESIEVGGVTMVRVQLLLENNGAEDAIVLSLGVSHSVSNVFSEQLDINFQNGGSITCQSCNVRDLMFGEKMSIDVTMQVLSDAPLGNLTTTLKLMSTKTIDTELNNNSVEVQLTVERRADLNASVNFLPEMVMYSNTEPEAPVERDEVGESVVMEVRVENVRSTTINNAQLRIYYPAASTETGRFFYLLPDCELENQAITSGTITCSESVLREVDAGNLLCDGAVSGDGRRRRHTISPAVKQRRRQARASGPLRGGLRRTARQQRSSLDCSVTPEDCLMVMCNITQLRGLRANVAKVTLRGHIDDRFFFDKDVNYQLTAFVSVSFSTTGEQTTDHGQEPDTDSAKLSINAPSSSSSDSRSSTLLIIVIVVVIVGSIAVIIVVAVILYCCGFFKRKRKPEEEMEPEGNVVVTETTGEKPPGPVVEGTTL